MRISRISVYQVDLPFDRGTYKLSGGRTWDGMDSSVIRIDTDLGIAGWGETCPFGPNYTEAFARGARAGIAELAPRLLGHNPSQPGVIYAWMDDNLLGHAYVKHAIDMACWDVLGKLTKQPLYTLLGGMLSAFPPTTGWIPPEHGDWMDELIARIRGDGGTRFSVKLSGNPDRDIEFLQRLGEKLRPGETVKCDANGGWRVDEALRVMQASASLDAAFEEPCGSYEEIRNLRRVCARPVVFDECALDTGTILRAWRDGVCDGVNLKLGRVGGITPALLMRDLCSELGIPIYVQCTGGSGITQAAIVHFAHATAPERLLSLWDIGDLCSKHLVTSPLPRRDGKMHAHELPGLGVEPDESQLGEPVAVYD